jgi:hypothetical protein
MYAEWAQRLPRFNALLSGVEPFVVAPRVARHADLRLCPGELTPSNISFTGAQTHSPDIEDTHPMSLEHQIITITLVCVGPDAPRVTAERRETVVSGVPPASLIHDQLEWLDVGRCQPVVGARRHPCVWKSGRQEILVWKSGRQEQSKAGVISRSNSEVARHVVQLPRKLCLSSFSATA